MIGGHLLISVSDTDVRVTKSRRPYGAASVRSWTKIGDLPGVISEAVDEVGGDRRLPRNRAIVIVGSFAVQVKRLPVNGKGRGTLDDVRRNVRRHFLVGGREPLLAGRASSDGHSIDVAAFDRTIGEAVVEACRQANLRLLGLVAEGFEENGRKLLLRSRQIETPAEMPAIRMALAGLVFTATVGLVLATPGFAARRVTAANQRELAHLLPTVQRTARDRVALEDVNRILAQVDTFSRGRRSMTLALAALTSVVPTEISTSDVRLDTLGGTFVVIGPRVAGIVDSMGEATAFDRVALSGAVTPQPGSTGPRERATVRFQWRRTR